MPLQVPFPLIKSLILIVLVIPEKALICYCPAKSTSIRYALVQTIHTPV